MTLTRYSFALLVVLAAALSGCGEKDIGPKTELTDEHKEQLKELNQQRVDEWGKKVK